MKVQQDGHDNVMQNAKIATKSHNNKTAKSHSNKTAKPHNSKSIQQQSNKVTKQQSHTTKKHTTTKDTQQKSTHQQNNKVMQQQSHGHDNVAKCKNRAIRNITSFMCKQNTQEFLQTNNCAAGRT